MLISQFGSGLSVVILSQKWSEVEQRLLLQIPLKLWLILDVITSAFIGFLSYRTTQHAQTFSSYQLSFIRFTASVMGRRLRRGELSTFHDLCSQ